MVINQEKRLGIRIYEFSVRAKKIPATQEGSRCRKIKQTYYEKTIRKI